MNVFITIAIFSWLAALGGYLPAVPIAIIMTGAILYTRKNIEQYNKQKRRGNQSLINDMIEHDFDINRYTVENVKKNNLKF